MLAVKYKEYGDLEEATPETSDGASMNGAATSAFLLLPLRRCTIRFSFLLQSGIQNDVISSNSAFDD